MGILPYVVPMGHGHGNGTSLFSMGSTSSNSNGCFFPASHVRDFSGEYVPPKINFPFAPDFLNVFF